VAQSTRHSEQAGNETYQMSAISELVFLDRYAIKDPNKQLNPGDIVVVLVKDDPKFPQREVGIVRAVDGDAITVEIKSTGEMITQERKKVDKPLETHPSQMWDRMAKAIVQVEEESKRAELEKEFRWALDNFRFSPGGRINAMLGTGQELTAYNCYVIPMEGNDPNTPRDSRQAIIDTLGNMVEIMSRGGGVGINLSTLRPRLAYVKGVNGRSSGAVSWGGLFSFATGLVEQGGSRRGALMLILNDWHPDILDFIKAKRDMNAITNANISVGVSNDFMKAVEDDRDWHLVFPDTSDPDYDRLWDGNLKRWRDEYKKPVVVYKTIRAREMWDTIIESAWLSAEPGVVFLERMNEYSNAWYFEDLISTNPCFVGSTRLATSKGYLTCNELFASQDPLQVLTDARVPAICSVGARVGSKDARPCDLPVGVTLREAFPVFRTGRQVPVYRLRTRHGYEVTATADHRFLTASGWKELKDLKTGETLFLQSAPGLWNEDRALPKWEIDDPAVRGRLEARIRRGEAAPPSQWSKELGQIIGWLVGDGYTYDDNGKPVLTLLFGPAERELMPTFRGLLKAWFGVAGSVTARNNTQALQFKGIPARFFRHLGVRPSKATEKRVPESIWSAPKDAVIGFLQGLFTSDGTVNVSCHGKSCSVRLASNSRELLQEVQLLLLNLGIVSRLHLRREKSVRMMPKGNREPGAYDTADNWELLLDKINRDRFAAEIGFLTSDKQQRLLRYLESKTRPSYVEYFTTEVASIEFAGVEDVYDTHEPVTHSVIANGIVAHQCGEQPLPGWGVCNLGHINLSRFVKDGEVLWDDLRKAVRLGVRFLDNVIDITPYFFEKNERVQKSERRIGLGTMGLGEMLIELGLRYGSDESIAFIDKLYEFIATEAYLASTDLAKEKGPFPKFDAEKYMQSRYIQGLPERVREKIARDGIRNVCLLTQAPTGSTGTMIGTSTGIEPYFSWTYWRKGRLGMKEVQEPIVERWFERHPEVEPKLENLPDYFVTAMDLTPKEHIRVQAAIQRWTDSSISKTANCPNHYTVEQTKELYEYAYRLGCKGVTIYRDGSRNEQVLTRKDDDKKDDKKKEESTGQVQSNQSQGSQNGAVNGTGAHAQAPVQAPAEIAKAVDAYASQAPALFEAVSQPGATQSATQEFKWEHRPQKLTGATYEWPTPLGKAFITVNELNGRPVEVFVNIGKAGSDVAAASEALGRLTTLFLKYAAIPDFERKVQLLIDHLANIGGSTSVGFGENRVSSVPDAVAKTLRKHLAENGSGLKVKVRVRGMDLCPTCGTAALAREEGCYVCKSCGYSKC